MKVTKLKTRLSLFWDSDGILRGGEVEEVTRTEYDDGAVNYSIAKLLPIAGAVQDGIKLKDVMSDFQVKTVANVESLQKDVKDLKKTLSDREDEIVKLRNEVDRAKKDAEAAIKSMKEATDNSVQSALSEARSIKEKVELDKNKLSEWSKAQTESFRHWEAKLRARAAADDYTA